MFSMNSKQCCCTWCGKGYKTRVNLEKHVILCELIYKSSKKRVSNKNSGLTDLNSIDLLTHYISRLPLATEIFLCYL